MKEKLAMDLAGESTTRIVALDGTTADDVINKRSPSGICPLREIKDENGKGLKPCF